MTSEQAFVICKNLLPAEILRIVLYARINSEGLAWDKADVDVPKDSTMQKEDIPIDLPGHIIPFVKEQVNKLKLDFGEVDLRAVFAFDFKKGKIKIDLRERGIITAPISNHTVEYQINLLNENQKNELDTIIDSM